MGKLLIRFLLTAVLTYGLSKVLPGVTLDGFSGALILVLVLAVLNATVKPLLKFFGFPLTVVTLGLFLLVINVIIVKLADYLMDSFAVDGWLNAFILSLALALVSSVVDILVGDDER